MSDYDEDDIFEDFGEGWQGRDDELESVDSAEKAYLDAFGEDVVPKRKSKKGILFNYMTANKNDLDSYMEGEDEDF